MALDLLHTDFGVLFSGIRGSRVSFQLPEGKSSCQGEGGAHVAHVLLQGGARDDVSVEMSQILFTPSAPCSLTHISWAPRQIRVIPEVRWFLPSLERLRGIKAPP